MHRYETQQDPVGLLVTKAFCVPCFLFVGNRFHSASLTFSEFQRVRFKQLLIREGRGWGDKGGAVKEQ